MPSKRVFLDNIEEITLKNNAYRDVKFTGEHEQLVLMCLKPGEEIGEEVHDIDQFFRFEEGSGKIIVDGITDEIKADDGLIIPAGLKHNIINTSSNKSLKLYTIYSKPQHPEGAVFNTKEEADVEEHGDDMNKAWNEFKKIKDEQGKETDGEFHRNRLRELVEDGVRDYKDGNETEEGWQKNVDREFTRYKNNNKARCPQCGKDAYTYHDHTMCDNCGHDD